MRRIAVRKTISAWPRFFLVDDSGQFWSGEGWSGDKHSALLFADWNAVSHQYRLLEEQQWSCVPAKDYEAVIRVRVWSNVGCTAEEVREYLHKAVHICLDHEGQGAGPNIESMARIDIDWTGLEEIPPRSKS